MEMDEREAGPLTIPAGDMDRPAGIAPTGEVMRQPSGQQFTVQAEIHHPPRGMQEDLPRQLEMNEQDEAEYPAIEMEDAPARPALTLQRDPEPLPLQMEVEDEVYNPAVAMDEPMPELEHQPVFPIERTEPPLGIQMEVGDEVYNPEIEMQEPPPRVEFTTLPQYERKNEQP